MTDELRRLLDERAIARVIADYGHFIDYGKAERWLGLFTEDARYVLRYRDGLVPRAIGTPQRAGGDLVYAGRAMLEDFIAAHSHAPARWHKHIVAAVRIDVEGDEAAATSTFMRVDQTDEGARIVAAGRYSDRLSRDETGAWRFRERIAEIEVQ